MRTVRVFTHYTCNQACTYCTVRRAEDDAEFAAEGSVRARIDAALRSGAEEIVLTGGEPTMRGDLVELVAHARAGGARTVVLETNATLLDAARAAALRAAGLGRARVNLTLADASLDAITGDAGGSVRTWRGLAALATAGVPVEIGALLLQETHERLAELPAALHERAGAEAIRCIEVTVPTDGRLPQSCIDYALAAASLQRLDDAARRVGIAVRLAPGSGPPPCLFKHIGRTAHFFALGPSGRTRAGFSQVAACATCIVADRCPGFADAYLRRHGVPASLTPIRGERLLRRLSIMTRVEDQIERDVAQTSYLDNGGGRVDEPAAEHLIRVNFHCNQSCRFCFVYTHLPPATDARIRQAIRDAVAADARVVFTGGEPTLNPLLGEYVALARSLSRHPIWLQTNAIKLDDAELTQRLVAAGVAAATVSLHACTPELSDAITDAPNTFVRTVAGLDQLARTPVRVTLNTVITARNVSQLSQIAEFIVGRWPRFHWNVSFVAPSSELVPRDAEFVPRYPEVAAQLSAAWRLARARGLTVTGVDAQCGLPLCVLPVDVRETLQLADLPDGAGGAEFLRPPPCERCSLRRKCFGVRRGYLAMYGHDELRPLG